MSEFAEVFLHWSIKHNRLCKEDVTEAERAFFLYTLPTRHIAPWIELPDHEFFKQERFDVFIHGCSSYYTHPQALFKYDFDEITKIHHYTILTSVKNEDRQVSLFVNFLSKFIDVYEPNEVFLGYKRNRKGEPSFIWV